MKRSPDEPRKDQKKRKKYTKGFQGSPMNCQGTIIIHAHVSRKLNYSFRRLGIHLLFEKSFDLPPVLPKSPPDDDGGMVPEFMEE